MWKCSPLCEMTMKDDLLLDDVCAWCPVQACFVDCMWLAGNTDGLTEYHPALLVDYACSPAVWTPPPFSSSPSASYAHYTSAPEPPLLWPATPLPRNPHFCDPLHLCPGTPTFVTRYTSAPEPPLLWPATPLPQNPHFCDPLHLCPETPFLWTTTPLPRNPHFCDPLYLCPGTPTFVTRYTSAPEPPLLWPATPLPRNPHFRDLLHLCPGTPTFVRS